MFIKILIGIVISLLALLLLWFNGICAKNRKKKIDDWYNSRSL